MFAVAGCRLRPQSLQQAVGQSRRFEYRAQEQKTAPRIFLARRFDQHFANLRITGKTLGTLQQPNVELSFGCAQVGSQFRVVAVRVIHEKARMHLEKLRQQRARRLRHVRASAVFNLRKIGLADGRTFGASPPLAQLLANRAHQLELRHGTPQPAQRTFHLAQVADFFAELHRSPFGYIPTRDIYIAICDLCQEDNLPPFQGLGRRLRSPSTSSRDCRWQGGAGAPGTR